MTKVNENYRSGMILHYYVEGHNIKVVLSNGAVITYPYSSNTELQIINRIKKQIEEIKKLEKKCKRFKNLTIGSSAVCVTALAASSILLAATGTQPNATDAILTATGIGTACYLLNKGDKAGGELDNLRKYRFYMENHAEVYDALTQQFYATYSTDAEIDNINLFNTDIKDYSLSDLESIAQLRLEK